MQDLYEFIVGSIRMAHQDAVDFPKKRKELVKCLFASLVLGLREKQQDRDSVEDLACAIAFMAIYNRPPRLREVRELQLDDAIRYFEDTYPEDIFDPE